MISRGFHIVVNLGWSSRPVHFESQWRREKLKKKWGLKQGLESCTNLQNQPNYERFNFVELNVFQHSLEFLVLMLRIPLDVFLLRVWLLCWLIFPKSERLKIFCKCYFFIQTFHSQIFFGFFKSNFQLKKKKQFHILSLNDAISKTFSLLLCHSVHYYSNRNTKLQPCKISNSFFIPIWNDAQILNNFWSH